MENQDASGKRSVVSISSESSNPLQLKAENRTGREILESVWDYIRNEDASERGRYSDGEKSILFWIFRETFLEHDSPESDSERARR